MVCLLATVSHGRGLPVASVGERGTVVGAFSLYRAGWRFSLDDTPEHATCVGSLTGG